MNTRTVQTLLLLVSVTGVVSEAHATTDELLASLRTRREQMAQFYKLNRQALVNAFEIVERIVSARTFFNLPNAQQNRLKAVEIALREAVSTTAAEEFESRRNALEQELAAIQTKVDAGNELPPAKFGHYLYLSFLKQKWDSSKMEREEAPRQKALRSAPRPPGTSDEEMLWNYLHARHHITAKVTRDTCVAISELFQIRCPNQLPSSGATHLDTLQSWVTEAESWRAPLRDLGYTVNELEGIDPSLTLAKK